ncbi:diguanylate cyclase [Serratia grimesii]|jgi:diguanylate cyclase (GGDEF)-like protein|uniref:diguanylate cyclase n=1 Tax=Serratia grimesii TaxID=82995 RepID=UPI00383B2896
MNKLILIENILNKRHPVRIIDGVFAVFFIFIGAVVISQMHTLISSYMSSTVNEMVRTHEILMENKANQVNKIISLEKYFSYVFKKKPSGDEEREYIKVIEASRDHNSFRYTFKNDDGRGIVINIIGKDFFSNHKDLSPKLKSDILKNEINAIIHFFSLLQLTRNNSNIESRIYYVSKSGLYATTESGEKLGSEAIAVTYDRMINSSYFINGMKSSESSVNNIFTAEYEGLNGGGKIITMFVPVIVDSVAVGVICFDFEVRKLGVLLNSAISNKESGNYFWIDGKANIIASSAYGSGNSSVAKKVLALTNDHPMGQFFDGMKFVTYKKIKGEYGSIFVTHSPLQALKSQYGIQLIFAVLLWVSFTIALLLSYILIRKLIKEMYSLQSLLEWKASYDSLTNVLNRNGFYNKIESSLLNMQKNDLPISIIQIDLDNFKIINDTYGHFAGDFVLTQAASTIKKNVRSSDILGRLGGEEFCIYCPNLNLEESRNLAERIRQAINFEKIEVEDDISIKISASFGIACSLEIKSYNIKELQAMSDKRLYIAKDSGRNRVCVIG